MAIQSRAALSTTITTNVNDNVAEDVTPAEVRECLNNLNDSNVNKTTDTNLIGWYEFDITKNYYIGELVIYSNNLYEFTSNHSAGAWASGDVELAHYTGATQFSASLLISSADVLALFTTPKTLVTCPSGRQIIVTGCSLKCNNGNTAYAVETDVVIYTNTATMVQATFTNILANFTTAAHVIGALNAPSYVGGDTQILANQDLMIKAPSANPTTGNYSITVYVTFRMV